MLPAREVVETDAAFDTGRASGDLEVSSVYEAGTRPAVGEFVGLIFTQPEPSGGFVSIASGVRRVEGRIHRQGQQL